MSDSSTTSLYMATTTEKPSASAPSIQEQMNTGGVAAAATVAAAAVNAAVSLKTLDAPDVVRSYVYRDGAATNRTGLVDEVGLPLVYDKDLIQKYWKKQGSALSQRWTEFLGYAVPFLTKLLTILVSGGTPELKSQGAALAKDAREIFEKLGPTYIKLGQMMSVRPDVLPKEALNELKILQDSVQPFDTVTAIEVLESELGDKLECFFSEISEEPVAAASLAQVYKAKLASTGEFVAVKVQRPSVLETVSKDLYVLRRAAEVYQGLMDRFAPQQRTNYVALLNEWAVGFYTELDFLNEAANQKRITQLMKDEGVDGIYVPKVFEDLCTRRVMVSEWIEGKKLSDCSPQEIKDAIPEAQEAFLTQLLQVGFFHSDPHPGNIMRMSEEFISQHEGVARAKLALLDFGLVAQVEQKDMDTMVSAIIHLANRDYKSLVDDFIDLEILPANCDRALVEPLMDKALTPYVKGGGAVKYEEELKKIYGMDGSISATAGGFSAMTSDAITVLNDIPFSIPPYFALLGRAIVTLEGIALTGDPSYGIIMEAYPFVARKLLSEDRPEIQRALQQVLYSAGHSNGDGLQATRLSVLLNSALGIVAKNTDAAIDFDTIPDEAVDIGTALKFLMGDKTSSLRALLQEEAVNAGDILFRQASRKSFSTLINNLPRPPFISSLLPKAESLPLPILLPSVNGRRPVQALTTPSEVLEIAAPKLSREEELYALSLSDLTAQTLGNDAAIIVSGDTLLDPRAAARTLLYIIMNGEIPALESVPAVRQLSSALMSFVDSSSSSSSKEDGLQSITKGLVNLNEEESRNLQQFASNVGGSILGKVLDRLQVLNGEGDTNIRGGSSSSSNGRQYQEVRTFQMSQ